MATMAVHPAEKVALMWGTQQMSAETTLSVAHWEDGPWKKIDDCKISLQEKL